MGRSALLVALAALLVCALEGRASACLSNVNCSGVTPVCGLSLACRACESDLECGAPLSGDVCSISGTMQGACVPGGPISDASTAGCYTDADCDVGLVCDLGVNGTSACVVGCHALAGGGDTCPIGEHCNIASTTIGVCLSNTASDAGSSTGACSSDSTCVPGLVCAPGPDGGASSCVVGCRGAGSNDTCPSGSECNVVDGGVGVCLGLVESEAGTSGPEPCTGDAQCGPGLVCDLGLSGGAECVVGCHAGADGGADTCAIATHCSVNGGALGICLEDAASGTGTANGSCNLDSDCVEGLVCDHALDGGAQCVFGCHSNGDGSDSCPSGAHCSNVGEGIGVCLQNGPGRVSSTGDASASSGGASSGGASSGGASSGGASSGGASSGGASSGGASSGAGASSGGASSGSGGDSGSSDASGEVDGAGGSDSGEMDATLGGDGASGMTGDASSTGADGGLPADGSFGDATLGADSGTDGYLEGAGCACSTAPGAGSATGGALGTMGVALGVAMMARGKRRKSTKKGGRGAR